MPNIPLLQIDAFTDALFGGNPAAVVPLVEWLPDAVMQKIAEENNLSETAFFVPQRDSYHLRWFTPTHEVDLCGHATLAAAWVVFHRLETSAKKVVFYSRSGALPVRRDGDRLVLDFPASAPSVCTAPAALFRGLAPNEAPPPVSVLASPSMYLCLYETEAQVRALRPDFAELARLDDRTGVIVTAPADRGSEVDFVSRFFAPRIGIPEDPVTGSAHTTLVPFWAGRLSKDALVARQVSSRGGLLHCRLQGERVEMAGDAVLYMEGTIALPLPEEKRPVQVLS